MPNVANPMEPSLKPPNKRLFVFCDGTQQDGLLAWEVSEDALAWAKQQEASPENPAPKPRSITEKYASNVFRLSRCIPRQSKNGVSQIVLYQSGVGVPENFGGNNSRLRTLISGTAVAAKIRDAYNFIVQNYVPGDEIYLFGFSRGAYTARKVAGLLDTLGLLDKKEMSVFFRRWKELYESDPRSGGPATKPGRSVDVQFLGVWDTVGAVRATGITLTPDILGFQDTSLPECVKQARHAICYHEERYDYLCIPFAPEGNNDRLAQVWFPGIHSDVGGGYKEHQIADISLLWMAGEIEDLGVDLDMEFLKTRLSPGERALEVHHEHRPHPFGVGDRHGLLTELIKHDSTYYHRSMWADLEHMKPERQEHLDESTERLALKKEKMRTLNQIEQQCWASRWTHYIKNPVQPQSRGVGAEWQPSAPAYREHDAPVEEESPEILFEWD